MNSAIPENAIPGGNKDDAANAATKTHHFPFPSPTKKKKLSRQFSRTRKQRKK
jgi:hypothetical protein